MTELDGASCDVASGSGEAPTMNALASMVQSAVLEMKAMNRRIDQLSEAVNLEDEDLDDDDGELEHADADKESIVSLDTKVNELTKAREAGNKKSESTSALHDIAQDLDLSEKTGSAVDEELANIVNSLLKDKIPDEKTQAKVDQYPKPANIEGLRTPRVNPLIWSQLPAQVRTQDSKHQKSQNSLVAAVVAITKATDIVLKQNQPDNKELLTTLTDGIALAMNCLHDMNSTRRQSMKRDLHRDYAALCNATTVPSSSELLFGDLSKLTKDISDANKLTKKVRPASHSSSRGRKSTFTNHSSANRNRRFAPYAYTRARYNDNNFFIEKPLSADEGEKGEHNQVINEPQNNKPLNKQEYPTNRSSKITALHPFYPWLAFLHNNPFACWFSPNIYLFDG